MILRRFLWQPTGCASYLLGCTTVGELALVDPHAELADDYLEAAQAAGSRIAEVIDTHVHADHRSGAPAIAAACGARLRLPAGAPVSFDFEALEDGELVVLGNVRLEVLSTPGHAWAHAALLVTDTTRGEEPWLLLSGDALFVGDVGRPDLHGEERALAAALEHSLRERLLTLPDWIELLPSHVGGSACGAGISSNPSSTIGFERRANALLALEGDAFVEAVLGRLSPPPPEFAEIYAENQRAGALTAGAERS